MPASVPVRAIRAASAVALLAVAPLATTVSASITPDARAVLARYVQATGGAAALGRDSTFHTLGRVTAFGLSGTVESWSRKPDAHANEVRLGPLKLWQGVNGAAAWRTDASGKVLALDGKDLDEARANLYFEVERWLEPDQGGGTIARSEAGKDSMARYDVLEVTPPVGRARTLWFAKPTGLLVRIVGRHDQQVITDELSNYRRMGARLVPASSVTKIAGMAMNDIHTDIDSAWVNERIPDQRFVPADQDAAPAKYLKRPGVATLPFVYDARHVWLRASVNGQPPADFLFDTGASITVIDSAYAERIGLETQGRQQGQGVSATGGASFASVKTLRVEAADGDGVELADQKVAVLAVNSFLAPYFWRDVAGVLGFDFIHRFVNQIDYDGHVLTLFDPKTFQYAGKGTAVPITLSGTTPTVAMTIDSTIHGDFRLDVGSNSTVDLHGPFVAKYGLGAEVPGMLRIQGGGFGGTFEARLRRMESISLGPYTWRKPIVSLSDAKTGAFASEDLAGNVGNQILERFKVTFDYERRTLWLEPGKHFAEPDAFSRTGLQLARYDDAVRVASVLPGSPAEVAGLRVDDRVLTIDGTPVVSLTVQSVHERLDMGAAGSRHRIGIERDGKKRTVSMVLRDLL